MKVLTLVINISLLLLFIILSPIAGQENSVVKRTDTIPSEPVEAILQAFEHYPIVTLGEGNHGNWQGATLRLSLLRDPRFLERVDDILVEFGASDYQDIMDRYISGEMVPFEKLRLCWEETTQPFIWDAPIYAEFFAAVRALNQSQKSDKRIRVLLGEPLIDWSQIKTKEGLRLWYRDQMIQRPWGKVNVRDGSAVDVIEREVMAKGRKALVIYGDAHFRRDELPLGEGFMADYFKGNFVNQMEHLHPGSVFTVTTFTDSDLLLEQSPDAVSWPNPSLIHLKGTPVGSLSIRRMGPSSLEQMFDALIWLGPSNAISQSRALPDAVADESYYTEMLRRDSLWLGQYQELLPRLRRTYLQLNKRKPDK
jgi:hypothetical protein